MARENLGESNGGSQKVCKYMVQEDKTDKGELLQNGKRDVRTGDVDFVTYIPFYYGVIFSLSCISYICDETNYCSGYTVHHAIKERVCRTKTECYRGVTYLQLSASKANYFAACPEAAARALGRSFTQQSL